MARSPAGGPATINGVLYQMLWSLIRTTRLHVRRTKLDSDGSAITQTSLTLEPGGGGGDLQLSTPDEFIAEQVKARTSGKPWSLKEIIEDVLPDLFQAVKPDEPGRRFHFVTEGVMGDWGEVYDFFKSLRSHACPEHGILAKLDDAKELGFRKGGGSRPKATSPFWSRGSYTQRSLFEQIVDVLLKRPGIAKRETRDSVRRKLWYLLAGFEFRGGQTAAQLQTEVDRYLLERIDIREQLPEKRDAMLLGLARLASQGDARIDRQGFLAQHLLDSTPLSNWLKLARDGDDRLHRTIGLKGYSRKGDVRQDHYPSILTNWPSTKPILLLKGEPGQGKSWHLFGLGAQLASENELCVLVEATADADKTLQKAADVFWQDIKGNDGSLSLARIAARRKQVVQRYAEQWITVLIDDVQDFGEARALAIKPWEEWGVRVVISCTPAIASTIAPESRGRATTTAVRDFTEQELGKWLSDRFGDEWTNIPRDVRDTLKRPLLAAIYEKVSAGGDWRPTNEYELYEAFWRRLGEDRQDQYPLDAHALKKAAYSLLKGGRYPWSAEQLKQAGLDNEGITRLRTLGWIRKTGEDEFEVWHDRLLNWAVAAGLIGALEHDEIDVDDFCQKNARLFSRRETFAGRYLGYVPMDVIWLLAHHHKANDQLLNSVIEALEATEWANTESLHEELLPTIGEEIIPVLFKRLVTVAPTDNTILLRSVIRGISCFQGAGVAEQACELLKHTSPLVQRAAMQVLIRNPIAKALDRLWKLHVDLKKSADVYLRKHESWHVAYEDSFGALRACVRLNPSWLERRIRESKREQEPVESLAWLLAGLSDGRELWSRCKKFLFKQVPPDKERSLAANIYSHRDEGEIKWIVSRVDRSDNYVAPMAMRALIRINPDLAVKHLRKVPKRDLYATRKWCFGELLTRRPDATRTQLLEMLKKEEHPWELARVYQGNEDAMDGKTLAYLLDSLERLLDEELRHDSAKHHSYIYIPLLMLADIHRLELLGYFAKRGGTKLESKLTDWLLSIGPRQGVGTDRLERDPAMTVLYSIGGSGFTQVINQWLGATNRYARLDGIELAQKRSDAKTIKLVKEIVERDELWNGHPLEQGRAAETLAGQGQWEHVIDAIMRWGLRLSKGVMIHRPVEGCLDDAVLGPVRALLSGSEPAVGAVLALSVSGRKDLAVSVHEAAKSAAPESELMLACVIALTHLGDRTPATEELFVSQLEVRKHRYAASRGLLLLGTPAAYHALSGCIGHTYDDYIVSNLAQNRDTQEAAARSLWGELGRSPRSGMADSQIECLGCLPDQEIRDYLRKLAFDPDRTSILVGHRASAIRGVAHFDPDGAFHAARKALEDRESRDRTLYPYLLMELNREKAAPLLLTQAVQESRPSLVAALARAVQDEDIESRVTESLSASDDARRAAACRFAGWCLHSRALVAAVRRCVDDSNERVAETAIKALDRLGRSAETQRLVAAIRTERDVDTKWILLDALLAVADPGDDYSGWPSWAREAAEGLPFSMIYYLSEALPKRRKKLAQELEKEERKLAT